MQIALGQSDICEFESYMPSHAVGSRPLDSARLVITSISWVSRIEDAKESLLRSRWDLVIVDEAHKMAAYSADKKTLAYKLGEALSTMTDHYLLMTATSPKATTWSTHSRRIDPISLSAKPFCQGERGAIGLSRMPMARNRCLTATP